LEALQLNEVPSSSEAEANGIAGSSTGRSSAMLFPAFSSALSLALCYANRASKESRNLTPRILLIKASPDAPAQYIPVMNCIFAAQKMQGLVIDACVLAHADSAQGQQAALLTKGLYLKPANEGALLQYLLSLFAVDPLTRQCINMPQQVNMDNRATCFCHKNSVDLGYICSVCLSVFCTVASSCATCGASLTSPQGVSRRTSKRARKSRGTP